jgi:predicted MFS family arabinose efflux permease
MRLVVTAAFVVALLGQSVVQLVAGISAEVYGRGGGAQGALLAVFGTGSILASLFLILTGDRRRRSRTSLTGLVMYGVGAVLSVATTNLAVGCVAFATMGTAHVLNGISLNTTLQLQVADAYRGRVISLYLMALLAGMPIGALVSGRLGDWFGLRPTIAVSGGLLVAYCVYISLRSGGLRGLDSVGEAQPTGLAARSEATAPCSG